MRRFGITAAVFLTLLLTGLAFVYYGLPRFIQPELLRAQILRPLEKLTAGSLTYQRFEFSYFPKFKVAFFDVRLLSQGARSFEGVAKRVEIEPDSFPLLIRQFRVRRLKIDGADIDIRARPDEKWTVVKFENVSIQALPLGTMKTMRIKTQGSLSGTESVVKGDLKISVSGFSDWNWLETQIHGSFETDSGSLSQLYSGFGFKNNIQVTQGTGNAKLTIDKEKGFNWLNTSGEAKGLNAAYAYESKLGRLSSLVMDASFDFEGTLNPITHEWTLRRSALQVPPGKIDISGQGHYQSGEIQDLRLSAPAVQLEQIPNFFVIAKEALPFNIGFSGLGQVELSFKGNQEKMAVYVNTDLAPAVLTYGRFLDKPKGVPCVIALDAMVHEGRVLNGDLSVRFSEVLAKGTVKDLDLSSGEGQINLITNKHTVAGWGPLVPFLRDLKLGGNVKMLANWVGDLHNLEEVKKVFNLTVQEGRVMRPSGAEIKDISVDLDYDSAMGLVIKRLDAQVGNTPIRGEVSIYNPEKGTQIKTILSSPEADLPDAISALSSFFSDEQPLQERFKIIEQWFSVLPPQLVRGSDFVFEAQLKDGAWLFEKWGINNGDGRVMAEGSVKTGEGPIDFETRFEMNRVSMDLLFPKIGNDSASEGSLFSNGEFSANQATPETFYQTLKGSGSVLMSQVTFLTVDLFKAIAQIPSFSMFESEAKGKTVFEDIRGHYRYENGKFISEDLVFLSPDFSIDGKGELSHEGMLNFRLDLYLSRDQASKVLGDSSNQMGLAAGEWFGPLPFLLTGSLEKPELRSDVELTVSLLNQVQRGNSQGAFRNFLREEALFEDFK